MKYTVHSDFESRKIMSVNEDNVWSGGPEPSNIEEGTKSLGELCLKRFKEQGDVIKLVGCRNEFLCFFVFVLTNKIICSD